MKKNIFAERLKAARELRRLTQADLAAKAGLHFTQVAHYEAGTRKPSYDNLRAFCTALRVNSDYLLGMTETPFDALRGGAFVVDPIYQMSQKLTAANYETAEDFLRMLVKKQERTK